MRPYISWFWAGALVQCLLVGCGGDSEIENNAPVWDGQTRFEALPPEVSGVEFANILDFDEDFNIYTYRNFYNGGGVALGDVNNDGLTDIYLSGNRVANRLFLNRGDMRFEDVTDRAGVAGHAAWSTGVTMADVNADGWLDIYVCNSGDIAGDNRRNELYINDQDGSFTEAAAAYGLDNEGLSTHGVFFDYDRDGDLDFYLLNNSYQAIGSFNLEKNQRPIRDSIGGDRLYRNMSSERGLSSPLSPGEGSGERLFVDVSQQAGIYGSIIGFGLGVTVGDIDRDGWPDIFVSNDFFERDYLYLNQRDGTFRETLTESMQSISAASMGADLADIDNDGYSELFVTEMLPATNQRMKEATTFENWNRYQYNLRNDYYHQFTRNMLQRNNGDGTFSEIGRLSGVEATDWSWGALIFDMDNDGYKDLFVANGIYQDLTNRDFLDYIADDEFKRKVTESGAVDFQVLVDAIPSNPVPNAAFQNLGPRGDFRFRKVAEEWGLDLEGFSNGAAYADLDNDGDLDLVINNTNAAALVYHNHTQDNHWLQLELRGSGSNTFAVGARVTVTAGEQQFYLEHMPMRGFESSMQYRLHFGLGAIDYVDRVEIEWPTGGKSTILSPAVDQLVTVAEDQSAKVTTEPSATTAEQFVNLPAADFGIDFVHRENRYSDFDRDPLIYHMLSAEGPALCAADFNRDGRQDFYLGGAKGQPGSLFVSRASGYAKSAEAVLAGDSNSEDVACTCFDADGDGDQDLYVVSGSSEFGAASTALFDRLYLNQGGGRWAKSSQVLPSGKQPVVGSTVAAHDFDGDGDQDLFVGARLRAGQYGVPADSYLLTNDGRGNFSERTMQELGMVTAARWVDIAGSPDKELVVVGEFMSPRAFTVTGQSITEIELPEPISSLTGWYTALEVADLDGDGRQDLILGNHGLNSRFRASPESPVMMHVNDFDGNGSAEQVVSTYEDGKAYPMPLLHDLVKQMPGLRKRYLKYADFGDQTMTDIFGAEALGQSVYYAATEFRSLVMLNRGLDSLTVSYLPTAAQVSPIRALLADDLNGDGHTDLLMGGNFYYAKPEVGRYDASRGLILLGDGRGGFREPTAGEPHLNVSGEVRGIVRLSAEHYLMARNDQTPVIVAW